MYGDHQSLKPVFTVGEPVHVKVEGDRAADGGVTKSEMGKPSPRVGYPSMEAFRGERHRVSYTEGGRMSEERRLDGGRFSEERRYETPERLSRKGGGRVIPWYTSLDEDQEQQVRTFSFLY